MPRLAGNKRKAAQACEAAKQEGTHPHAVTSAEISDSDGYKQSSDEMSDSGNNPESIAESFEASVSELTMSKNIN